MSPCAAATLGISEKTVKVHRGRVMQKVGARSVTDLVRISEFAATARRLLKSHDTVSEEVRP